MFGERSNGMKFIELNKRLVPAILAPMLMEIAFGRDILIPLIAVSVVFIVCDILGRTP